MKTAVINLKHIFESAKSNKIDRNLGVSLLDFDGNFLLMCKKSNHLFGVKNSDTRFANLFSLLIPYSRAILSKKFGSEMFSDEPIVKAYRNFCYVIFSKTTLIKFRNSLKKKNYQSPEDVQKLFKKLEESDNGYNLYNAYMTSIASSATIVTIKYTDKEIKELGEANKLVKKNKDLFMRDFVKKEYIRKSIGAEDNSDIEVEYVKHVILLKSRFSKKVPKFDYKNLRKHPTIITFEKFIEDRLLNQNKAQGAESSNCIISDPEC